MSPTPDAPDTSDYRVIHHCLRVAPHRIAVALDETEPGDVDRAAALARYWAGYAGEVLAHHTVEDEVFFPRLVERVPAAAHHLDRVEGDHHRLDQLMDAAAGAMRQLTVAPGPAGVEAAAAAVRELAHHMDSHLDFEDEDLLPLFGRHFTAAEYAELTKAAMQGLSMRQAAFTVPFVMHWAPPADQAEMLAGAPLPMRLLYRATRRRHARLTQLALGRAGLAREVLR